MNIDILPRKNEDPPLYVRIKTSCWYDNKSIHQKRSITTLRRKSNAAFDILIEDSKNLDANQVFDKIVNLDECKDGVYVVRIVNESKDWETEDIYDWDYMLIPEDE